MEAKPATVGVPGEAGARKQTAAALLPSYAKYTQLHQPHYIYLSISFRFFIFNEYAFPCDILVIKPMPSNTLTASSILFTSRQ
jgi:hypothetical protein